MAIQIVQHCEENGLFSESQFSFRGDKDTVKGILQLVTDVLRAFHDHQYSTVLFCDVRAVFWNHKYVGFSFILALVLFQSNLNYSPMATLFLMLEIKDVSLRIRTDGQSTKTRKKILY